MKGLTIELTDDDGTPTGETVPRGNDRMFRLELHNRGRVQFGTATIHRLTATFFAIRKRYPHAARSSKAKPPMVMRRRRAGPVVLIVTPLEGPVASLATKH
jgi:hypothetical protein